VEWSRAKTGTRHDGNETAMGAHRLQPLLRKSDASVASFAVCATGAAALSIAAPVDGDIGGQLRPASAPRRTPAAQTPEMRRPRDRLLSRRTIRSAHVTENAPKATGITSRSTVAMPVFVASDSAPGFSVTRTTTEAT
jgi:hypothetical protein